MYKVCSRCTTEKLTSEFRKDNSTVDGFQHCCKLCRREYDKSNYIRKYGVRSRQRSRKRHADINVRLRQYKLQHPCSCGENNPVCLDFHHTDNNKEFGVSSSRNRSWEIILKEIKKCVVICSNCHRKLHASHNKDEIEQTIEGYPIGSFKLPLL